MSILHLHSEPRPSFYCARCLREAGQRDEQCHHCETPFTGSGRFDLICGAVPSTPFRGAFRRRRPETLAPLAA